MQIIILSSGFVFAGKCAAPSDGWIEISQAWNIRRYGTTRGLGQLALEGVQKETVLDKVGQMRAPLTSVVAIIEAPRLRI